MKRFYRFFAVIAAAALLLPGCNGKTAPVASGNTGSQIDPAPANTGWLIIANKEDMMMGNPAKGTSTSKVLLIIGGSFSILLWLALLFYGFFLGGSPGPGYERMVPIAYAGVMASGFFGAVAGLIGVATEKKAALFAAARNEEEKYDHSDYFSHRTVCRSLRCRLGHHGIQPFSPPDRKNQRGRIGY